MNFLQYSGSGSRNNILRLDLGSLANSYSDDSLSDDNSIFSNNSNQTNVTNENDGCNKIFQIINIIYLNNRNDLTEDLNTDFQQRYNNNLTPYTFNSDNNLFSINFTNNQNRFSLLLNFNENDCNCEIQIPGINNISINMIFSNNSYNNVIFTLSNNNIAEGFNLPNDININEFLELFQETVQFYIDRNREELDNLNVFSYINEEPILYQLTQTQITQNNCDKIYNILNTIYQRNQNQLIQQLHSDFLAANYPNINIPNLYNISFNNNIFLITFDENNVFTGNNQDRFNFSITFNENNTCQGNINIISNNQDIPFIIEFNEDSINEGRVVTFNYGNAYIPPYIDRFKNALEDTIQYFIYGNIDELTKLNVFNSDRIQIFNNFFNDSFEFNNNRSFNDTLYIGDENVLSLEVDPSNVLQSIKDNSNVLFNNRNNYSKLRVSYLNNPAIDEGGVSNDFFEKIAEELVSKKYFCTDDNNYYNICKSDNELNDYFFIGQFYGWLFKHKNYVIKLKLHPIILYDIANANTDYLDEEEEFNNLKDKIKNTNQPNIEELIENNLDNIENYLRKSRVPSGSILDFNDTYTLSNFIEILANYNPRIFDGTFERINSQPDLCLDEEYLYCDPVYNQDKINLNEEISKEIILKGYFSGDTRDLLNSFLLGFHSISPNNDITKDLNQLDIFISGHNEIEVEEFLTNLTISGLNEEKKEYLKNIIRNENRKNPTYLNQLLKLLSGCSNLDYRKYDKFNLPSNENNYEPQPLTIEFTDGNIYSHTCFNKINIPTIFSDDRVEIVRNPETGLDEELNWKNKFEEQLNYQGVLDKLTELNQVGGNRNYQIIKLFI
tara:strand:+ start:2058 stop:4574 length:2517 start_codon:yes stop_codon:yes gene_type:complete